MSIGEQSELVVAGVLEVGLDVLAVYREFGDQLPRIVRCSVDAPEALVEDACQAAWARLLRHRRRVSREAAYAWLLKTALHEARRLAWRGSRDASLEGEAEERSSRLSSLASPGPEVVLAWRERLRVVGDLPERQQRLVWLRALGLSYEEIASREQTTSRTVHRQLDRARYRLRLLEAA